MSKRPGEDLESDPTKKQKVADLPTAPAAGSKISYGSLKPPTSSGSSISYAALRKQQVSTMKQPIKPGTSSLSSSATNPASLSSANLQTLQSAAKLPSQTQPPAQTVNKISESTASKPTSSEQSSSIEQSKPVEQSESKFSESQSTPSNESQGQTGAPKSVDLKSQQQQIIERARKLKEEERRLRELKKNTAVMQKVSNSQSGVKPVPGQATTQKTSQQLKEDQKKQEKKPLTKYEQEIQSLQKYAMKKELEKKKIEHLIKTGKLKPEDLQRQQKKDEIKVDGKEIDVRVDKSGKLVDSKGNEVVVNTNKSSLKINIQKKQQERLIKMKRNALFQSSQVFQDSNLFMTTSIKRDRKKIHALNFIEDTNEEGQEDDNEDKMDIEGSDDDNEKQDDNEMSISSENENEAEQKIDQEKGDTKEDKQQIEKNDDFRHLILKSETDYRREEFQKSNSRYLQSLHKKKQSLKQKHHDPIPDIEWWDLPLFDNTRRYYLPLDQINSQVSESTGDNQSSQMEQENQQANENNLTINILDNLENIKQLLSKLQSDSFNYSTEYYRKEKISNLIEHPKPFKNEGLPSTNQTFIIPNYLTKQEQKKLRRRHRLEKEKEKQDKIKLGLLEPPPPKVRLRNMMRVLGNEAVADPTKMEAMVRQGIADRLQEHLRRNEERKLTKEEKAEKFLRKLKRDSAIECRVALFRIENLQDRVHKFKVDINSQQMQLHGLLINPVVNADTRAANNMPAIVLVEGGPKAIKFYKKLMLRRIKWNKNSYLPKDENGNVITPVDLTENKCALVWEGVVKDHNFNKWKVHDVDNEVEARRAFSEKNVEFYFDMAINYQYPQ